MFLGLSATYWWHKHVVLHHPAPNVVGVNGDADLLRDRPPVQKITEPGMWVTWIR
jgi:hypothetical protein